MNPDLGPLPVHPAQLGMIAGHLQVPGQAAYSVSQLRRIRGPLDLDSYVEANARLVEETDCIRTRFQVCDGTWIQHLDLRPRVTFTDLSDRPDAAERADRRLRSSALVPFDLLDGSPLYRLELVRIADEDHLELATVHHAIADGFGSMRILHRHAEIYASLRRGSEPPPAPRGSLRELIAQSPPVEPDLDFWRSYLAKSPDRIALSDTVAPPASLPLLARVEVARLRAALSEAVGELRWPYAVMAAVAEYVADTLGTSEAILGCIFAARSRPVELVTPSMLMTVLPMRVDLRDRSRRGLLRTVARAVGGVAGHVGDRPERLRTELPIAWRRGRIHGPTVNVVPFGDQPGLDGCDVDVETISRGPVDDMIISIVPAPDDGLIVDLAANPNCYTPHETETHAAGLLSALGAWV